ncbi:MAG TPA: hypothetical protein VGI13_16060, partial [Candidatus Acidoferrum sp.]
SQRIGGCWSHECSGDEIFDFSTQPLPRRECAVKSAVASTPHTGHWCNHDQTTGFDPKLPFQIKAVKQHLRTLGTEDSAGIKKSGSW